MNTLEFAWDGTNPLYVLAALGALAATTADEPDATLHWAFVGGQPQPRLQTRLTEAEWAARTLAFLGRAATYADFGEHIAEGKEKLTKATHDALAVRNWHLLAHLAGLTALTSTCEGDKGQLPSTFSFSNGASGKMLLKDWRALTAGLLAGAAPKGAKKKGPATDPAEALVASLHGEVPPAHATSLNWDPADLRLAAYRWFDPGDGTTSPTQADVAANVFAFLGLGLLPSVPRQDGLEATAFLDGDRFVWPLWTVPLRRELITALLAEDLTRASSDFLRARGIPKLYESKRYVVNKRAYFRPATPL